MRYGSHHVSSPGFCISTQDYNEWMDKHYPNNENKKFYCDDCERNMEFYGDKCSNYHSHRVLVTCNYCQKDFKTHSSRDLRCLSCCRSIERKLKTYTFEKLKKISQRI